MISNMLFKICKIFALILTIFLLSSIGFSNNLTPKIGPTENMTYAPVTVTIHKQATTGTGYFFLFAYLTRFDPAIFAGLLLIGTVDYLTTHDKIDSNMTTLAFGMIGFNLYAQTLPNKDTVSLIGNSSVLLASIFFPSNQAESFYGLHHNIFENKELGIDSFISDTIFLDLAKRKYVYRQGGYYGEFTEQIQTTKNIEEIFISTEFLKYEKYIKWVLTQIFIFQKTGRHKGVIIEDYNKP